MIIQCDRFLFKAPSKLRQRSLKTEVLFILKTHQMFSGSPEEHNRDLQIGLPVRDWVRVQFSNFKPVTFPEPSLFICMLVLRSAHTMGLVPATSPCNKSQGLVASCELAIFATKSSRRDQNLVPATSPTNSNWFDFVGLVAGTEVGPCD